MPLPGLPRKLKIPKGARVLEVGSGGRPHHRSTVLTDRFLADASHREGKALTRDSRPVVVADGEALPFKDQAFDYCICMHVLEHVDHPDRLLAEMQRVAKAGYIETPSELFDWLFATEPYTTIHKWLVNLELGEGPARLTLKRKTPQNGAHRFGPLLDHLRREDPYLERWLEKRPELFTVQYEWSGQIQYKVEEGAAEPVSGEAVDPTRHLARAVAREPYFWGSGSWGIKRWIYSLAVHPALRKAAKRLLAWRNR